MMCNNIFFAEMEMEFCSASAIIFLFANDFIERLICFVFALSMKLRSSLTCCDERISILSRAEWERFSVQIWVVGYLGSILTRFTISTNVVVDVWLLLKAAASWRDDMKPPLSRRASKQKNNPKKEVKRTNGSGSNMVGLLKRKKCSKENFSKNSCSKAIYDFLK